MKSSAAPLFPRLVSTKMNSINHFLGANTCTAKNDGFYAGLVPSHDLVLEFFKGGSFDLDV